MMTDDVYSIFEDSSAVSPSIQVVSVDDLIDRLTSGDKSVEPTDEDLREQAEAVALEEQALLMEQARMEEEAEELGQWRSMVLTELTTIRQDLVDHPLMTTHFSDYTVTEGLLLLLVLGGLLHMCIRMIKGGFSWLM